MILKGVSKVNLKEKFEKEEIIVERIGATPLRQLISIPNAIRIAEEYANRTCYWRWNDETDDDYYNTECKHTFSFSVGVLEDNETFNYCPFCGGKIAKVK